MPAIARIGSFHGSLLLLLTTPYFVFGQAPSNDSIREVEVCQILRGPDKFDGQTVRFRGRLELEFEGDGVNDNACGLPLLHTGIWWTYGGEPLIASQSEAKQIQSMTSPVVRDAQFSQFEARTHEHRARRPDGNACRSHHECAYYDVVATFTGRFFAGKMRPGRTRPGGFGHMGCCHLFVIEQVGNVDAQRTAVPIDAQNFSCTSTTWQSEYAAAAVSSIEGRVAANRQFLADQMRDHGDAALVEAMDRFFWPYLGLGGRLTWASPDLLTTYTAQFPQESYSKKKKHAKPPAKPIVMSVTREHCEAATNLGASDAYRRFRSW